MASDPIPNAEEEGFISWGPDNSFSTWYRITGSLQSSPNTPLVILHGGPGGTHDYTLTMADLAATSERAVIHYDQLGNGRSTHLPERAGDASFWTIDLFVQELDAVLDYFNLPSNAAGYHILGHSWGGFLALEHAYKVPRGLRTIVLSDSAASFPEFTAACNKWREELPADVQATLQKHEAAGTEDDLEYEQASMVLFDRHLCRVQPWPKEMIAYFEWVQKDPSVHHTMNGPSEFLPTGTIKDWSFVNRLPSISISTLIISGKYDYASPSVQQTIKNGIDGSEWVLFEESSHVPHIEERERYMQVVGDWLRKHD